MRKILNLVSYLTLLMALVVVLIVTYWMTYPYKPVEFKNLPHKIDTKQIKAGEYLTMNVDYCKYSTVVPVINTAFIDGIIYYVPQEGTINTVKPGCGENKVFIYIPKALPPGNYSVHRTWKYKVNPLRTITIYTQSETFEVVK
jgi:hypothetical protein